MEINKGRELSAQASVTGVQELFLIIVGLGVTFTVVDGMPYLDITNMSWALIRNFCVYLVMLMGYLAMVLQFTLSSFNVLSAIAHDKELALTKSLLVVSVCFVLSAVSLGLMGEYLVKEDFVGYVFFMTQLYLLHMVALVSAHQPWKKMPLFSSKSRYWDWFFFKVIYYAVHGIRGKKAIDDYQKIYNRRYTDVQPETKTFFSEERKTIKSTHYWWCSSNVWLLLVAMLLLLIFMAPPEFMAKLPPIMKPTENWDQAGTIVKESQYCLLLLNLALAVAAYFNFRVNGEYFFGARDEKEPDRLYDGVLAGFFYFWLRQFTNIRQSVFMDWRVNMFLFLLFLPVLVLLIMTLFFGYRIF